MATGAAMETAEPLPFESQDSSSSSSSNQEIVAIKKLKKFRSLKLIRVPSKKTRSKTRSYQHHHQPDESNSSSPNYMKPTSCSELRKEIYHQASHVSTTSESSSDYDSSRPNSATARLKSTRFFEGQVSLSPISTVTEISSLKSKKPAKKPKKSIASSQSAADVKKIESRKVLMKTISFRPVRILRTMKPPARKCTDVYEDCPANVYRATCSSTFKDSKFTKQGEFHQLEGTEFDETASTKVCTYTFCSLHGSHRDPAPPLKRFVSVRRRFLRSQKSMKPRNKTSDKKRGARVAKNMPFLIDEQPDSVKKVLTEVEETGVHDKTSLNSDDMDNVTYDLLDRSKSETSDDFKLHSVGSGFDEVNADMTALNFGSPAHNQTSDFPKEMRKEKDNYISMWRLIHQSLSSNDKAASQLTLHGAFDNTDTLALEKKPGKKIEHDAIKLVKDAIDEILLPEIQDRSSDDTQSITSDMNHSDEEFQEEKHGEVGEENLSIPTKILVSDEKPAIIPKNNTTPKNWSKLKKLIIFKRFMKALDKVRNLNFKEAQYLLLDHDLEPERVNLRPQTAEERKRAEEWMLDYALRQVVSNLTPARRRKVELLVEAFETVIPESGNETRAFNKIAIFPRMSLQSQGGIGEKQENGDIGKEQENDHLQQGSSETCHNNPKNQIEEGFHGSKQGNEEIISSIKSESSYDVNESKSKILEKGEEIPMVDQSSVLRSTSLTTDEHFHHLKSSKTVVPTRRRNFELLVEAFETVTPESGNENRVFTKLAVSPSINPRDQVCTDKEQENIHTQRSNSETRHDVCTDQKKERLRGSKLDSEEYVSSTKTEPCCDDNEPDIKILENCEKTTADVQLSVTRTASLSTDEDIHELKSSKMEVHTRRRKVELLVGAFEPVIPKSGNGTHIFTKTIASSLINPPSQACIDKKQENDSTRRISSETYPEKIKDQKKERLSGPKPGNEEIISITESKPCYNDKESNIEIVHKNEKPFIVDQSSIRTASLDIDKDLPELKPSKTAGPSLSERVHKCKQESEIPQDTKPEGNAVGDKQKYMKMWRVIYQQVVCGSAENFGNHKDLDGAAVYMEGEQVEDAIKMVEKAIDEVILPEGEDQSIIISDLKQNGCANTNKCTEESQPESVLVLPEQDRMQEMIDSISISTKPKPNSWSNLKKHILLNRFVKTLAKVRESKFNPREPRYLMVEPDPQKEKVNLKQQTMDERKKGEEWMLDNAIQQVVARLTPARKRRVELLVEAFESVTPLSEIGSTPKNSSGTEQQRLWPTRSPRPRESVKLW